MIEWMERPHRRLNPLTGDWVLVSPQRTNRPWQGRLDEPAAPSTVAYDPRCYLCPGNQRAGGVRNPAYTSTFVFDNDFPALLPENSVSGLVNDHDVMVAEPDRGICRVICFSPRHDLAIPSMDPEALTAVVETWRDQSRSLSELPFIRYVQLFENRGALMGASNPHPHCQVWATENVPNEIVKEETRQVHYRDEHQSCLLCDYLNLEDSGERWVCENQSFRIVVPFWAVWPFETLVLPKRHIADLEALQGIEASDLGMILKDITRRYDILFGVPFPYSMGFHQKPVGSRDHLSWHLHAHFYPPLLRSADIRKFMVGYELLAEPQRDLTPEAAASRLREARI
jgi:UDPglucose--hexose-1-phosphate uridylyltransferase